VGEKHLLAKARLALCGDDLSGEPGEVRVTRAVIVLPGERHERGTARLNGEFELCSDAVGEVGGAHLWNRETASRDH
jgi:hypothetical protein